MVFNFFKKNKEEHQQKQEEQIIKEEVSSENNEGAQNLFGISFSNLKDAVSKTSEALVESVVSVVKDSDSIDEDMLDEIEERLIRADLGLDTAVEIVEKLRKNKNKLNGDNLKDFLKQEFIDILKSENSLDIQLKEGQLNIILVVGVNGAGKTTLIGKLAHRFKLQGKKVFVAAGDTFRAAAEDQLEIWSNRAGAQIVRQDGADPAAVVFDSIQRANDQNADILIIDTAGRLQNKFNLMEELSKIKRVIDKEAQGQLIESMLVLDATTGQNGLKQAMVFKEAVQLTSAALTKLDGSAKGGIIIAIAKEMQLPVKLIGVGEKLEDLKDFNPDDFVEALF